MFDHPAACLARGLTDGDFECDDFEGEPEEENGTRCCLVCGKPIADPARAMVTAPRLTEEGELPPESLYFVHKGVCLSAIEHWFDGALPTEELITWLQRGRVTVTAG